MLSVPALALLDSGTVRSIAMLRIAGILGQQFTGNIRAFAAVEEPFLLAAHGNGTFAVKRVSVVSIHPPQRKGSL